MSFMRSLGRISGRMGGNKEFISGMMEGLNPRSVADAINENADFMAKVAECLDPKAMADAVNGTMPLAAEIVKYLDPEATAEVMNRNERIIPRFVEKIDPNVFSRSTGALMNKMRYATYRPSQFPPKSEPGEESGEAKED